MAEAIAIGINSVHPNATVGTGTCNMLPSGPSAPPVELWQQGRALGHGDLFMGKVTRGREFPLNFFVENTGHATDIGYGYANWQALQDVLSPEENGLVLLKYSRDTAGGGTTARELYMMVVDEPTGAWVPGGDNSPGIRPNGNLVYQTKVVCPFPFWRSSTALTQNIVVTGAAANSGVVARTGQMTCGVRIDIVTTGTLSSMTIGDGTNTITMIATFGATTKYIDWYASHPWLTAIGSGVTIDRTGHIALPGKSGTTPTITCTPDGGASGTHTVTLTWYPLWKTV